MSAGAALKIREELRIAIVRELHAEPVKVIALRLGMTVRGARDIQNGESLPNAEHVAMLAREYPNIYAAWRRCVAPEDDGE